MRWLVVVLALSGCAQGPGHPWGILEPALALRLAPPAERLDANGALVTSRGYAVVATRLVARVAALETRFGGEEAAGFDPANPPPGYSLCHGGHCHADDGRLVDYADIAAELAGASGGARLVLGAGPAEVPLGPARADVPLEPCPADGCLVDRGRIVGAAVQVAAMGLALEVTDRTVPPRLSAPLRLDLDLALDVSVEGTASIPIGPGAPLVHRMQVDLQFPPSLFDDVDFAGLVTAPGPVRTATLTGALTRRLAEAELAIVTLENE